MTSRQIPLSRPDISTQEIQAVVEVLKSGVLSLGPKIEAFEARMAKLVGMSHAVAVNSGTSALHLCVRSLGISEGDEVITTSFSFVASANCILYERARPVFVDIDPRTYNMDPLKIERAITERTKAILAVDVFGVPCDWGQIGKIAKQHGLHTIEDSCEALGSRYRGRMAGSLGDCGVFGFYPNKQVTTGEGGVVTTNNERLASLCRSLRNQGRNDEGVWMIQQRLGYNFRLSDIHAALGLAQLDRLKEILERRSRVALWYTERLKDDENIVVPSEGVDAEVSWFVYVIRLADRFDASGRSRVMDRLLETGVECRPYFPAIHLQPFFRREFGYREGDFPVAEGVSDRTIALPFFSGLSEGEVEYVVTALKNAIKTVR